MNDNTTEATILGVLMLVDQSYWRIANDLTPEMFSDGRNATIYRAIEAMKRDSRGVDIITVKNYLQSQGILEQAGGIGYLSDLTDRVAGDGNLEAYAAQIKSGYLKRASVKVADQIKFMAQSPAYSGVDLLSHLDTFILESRKAAKQARESTIGEAVVSSIGLYEDRAAASAKGDIVGIGSGYRNLDAITGGFQGGQLIVIAGRPGMGKTAAAINFMLNAAFEGHSCGMFSLEMPLQELVDRAMSNKADVEGWRIQRGKLDQGHWEKIMNTGAAALKDLAIVITDKAAISINEIRAIATNWKHRHKINLLLIDYAQLVHSEGRSRNEEVGIVTRTLKQVAKELDLAVIALAQLSRSVEDTKMKIPGLRHLRDSGEIEQDADKVLFLWRPEYYGISTLDDTISELTAGTLTDGKICVIVEKNRGGAKGEAWLDWHPEYQRISEFTTPLVGFSGQGEGNIF